MTALNEVYFSKYLDGVIKDSEKRGEIKGEIRGENKAKQAILDKIEALIRKRGFPDAEIKEFIDEYSRI